MPLSGRWAGEKATNARGAPTGPGTGTSSFSSGSLAETVCGTKFMLMEAAVVTGSRDPEVIPPPGCLVVEGPGACTVVGLVADGVPYFFVV